MCVCVCVRVCVCVCVRVRVRVCVYFVNQAWGQDGGILDQDELEVHKNTKRFHFIRIKNDFFISGARKESKLCL